MNQLALFETAAKPVKVKPLSIDAQASLLADQMLSRCKAEGIDTGALLLRLQLDSLWESYLSRLPEQQQMEFVVRLIGMIQAANPDAV